MPKAQKNAEVLPRGLVYDAPTRMRQVDRRKPERRALFLADISRRLFESLDYEETLANVARLAMPERMVHRRYSERRRTDRETHDHSPESGARIDGA